MTRYTLLSESRWRLFKNASQKDPTIFPDHQASLSSTSASSARSPATKSPIFSTI